MSHARAARQRWWAPFWARLRHQVGGAALGVPAFLLLVPAALPLTAGGGIAPEFPLRVPCLFHWASGLPCPFCGMTRAFANLAQGRVAAAWAFSPAGCLLYGLLAVYLAAVLGHLVTGRRVWPQGRGRWAAWSLFIIILAGWLGKLARGSLGAP